MTRKLQLSSAAGSDLEEAWLYVAEQAGPAQADSVLEEIHAKPALLTPEPFSPLTIA